MQRSAQWTRWLEWHAGRLPHQDHKRLLHERGLDLRNNNRSAICTTSLPPEIMPLALVGAVTRAPDTAWPRTPGGAFRARVDNACAARGEAGTTANRTARPHRPPDT